jgi:hypothetical protein
LNVRVQNLAGRLKTYVTGLEVKAGQKALSLLREQGYQDVKLLQGRIWKVERYPKTTKKRELDVAALAANCLLVVEATVLARSE